MSPPSPPCQCPCPSTCCGCLHLQVSNSVSETSFPRLFSMTASFTWGTEKLWQLLNIELQEILLLGLQNLTLSRVQILLETSFHFEDQFRQSYFKPMSSLFTRRWSGAEQEEFVFWKLKSDWSGSASDSLQHQISISWLSQLLPLEVHFAPSSTNYFSNLIMLHICNLSWISMTCWIIPCVLPSSCF